MAKVDPPFFAWIYVCQPWAVPRLSPQLILDTGIADYLINHVNPSARLDIRAKHVLTLDEYNLTMDQLIKKYPAPELKT
jgi:hypothetical protein